MDAKPMLGQPYMKQLDTRSSSAVAIPQRGHVKRFIELAREIQERERLRLRAEILRIPGLMSLLMKPRNGERWSIDDRKLMRAQLRGLGVVGLYLATLAIPGTALTLPLLAWWLDRRRFRYGSVSENNSDKELTPPSQ